VPKKKQPNKTKKDSNTLRIIGGEWRSRKLKFIDAPGLRPTPDRVRETLFNWLQMDIRNARCLDLFAGSGAIGLEALSRGAREVVFIEKNAAIVNQLRENLKILNAESKVIHADALSYLDNLEASEAFDVIFLDPPYRQGLLEKSLNQLIAKQAINPNTRIYLEHESEEKFDWADYGLEVLKNTSAGQVQSYLLKQA
jgi:16S rRNA (guanine966-N2)-methyltransferase